MPKPIIGITPLIDYKKESLWMLPGYMDGVEEAGGVPLMLPLSSDPEVLRRAFSVCGGFILTGGQDVSPSVYEAEKSRMCGETSPERDWMETQLLRYALEKNAPLLGICRGLQFMNASLGGTLWQDLPSERLSGVSHRQSPPYDKPSHACELVKGSPLESILKADEIYVNSCHHQGIRELAPSLKAAAYASDGLVEGAYYPTKIFMLGVQWHPEFSYKKDENSKKIFRALIEAALVFSAKKKRPAVKRDPRTIL